MEDDNEDNLKNKEDLHIAGRHTALDIFRFAVFFSTGPQQTNLSLQTGLRSTGCWVVEILRFSDRGGHLAPPPSD